MRGSHPCLDFDVKFSSSLQHPPSLIATSNTFVIPNLAIQSECGYQHRDFELLEMSVVDQLSWTCGWSVFVSEWWLVNVFFVLVVWCFCLLVIVYRICDVVCPVYRCICVVLLGLFAPLLPICCSFGQLAETHTKFLVWDIKKNVHRAKERVNRVFENESSG